MNVPITEIMTKNVKTISPTAGLHEAEKILFSNPFKHLPVVHNGKLVGLISKTDIKRMSFANSFEDVEMDADAAVFQMLSVENVMISNPFTIQKTATIRNAAEVLSNKEFRSLPVMDGDKLLGIVTTKDVINYLLQFID